MKKNSIVSICFLLFHSVVFSQVLNGEINWELRCDQYWQGYNNTGAYPDKNEVTLGLYGDWTNGGTRTWNNFGPGCTGLKSNYNWTADVPSNSAANLNHLLVNCTNRNLNSGQVIISIDAWEESGALDCLPWSDPGSWYGEYTFLMVTPTKRPSLWIGPDDVSGSEWVAEDWTNPATRTGDAKLRSIWKYTHGSTCADPLNFGTLTNGTTLTHFNANRVDPANASINFGHTNVSGNASPDVFYSFTLTSAASVTISTNNTGTNYDTYLRLNNSSCGTQIAFNDDFTGTSSTITQLLCAGTYTIQVEGYNTNSGDFNLSVVANLTTLTGGTIAGITDGVLICPGVDPGSFTSTTDAGNGVPTYTYQWEQSTTSASTGFGNIALANSNVYNPTSVSTTTWFRRRATDACGTVAYSNVIQVAMNTLSTPITSVSGTNPICIGNQVTLTASGGTSGTGSVIRWYYGGSGTGGLAGTGASISVTPFTNTTYYVRREGTCNNSVDYVHNQTVTSPSNAGLVDGDYVWGGYVSNNWNNANNWLVLGSYVFTIATAPPTATNNVYINAPTSCTAFNPNTLSGTCYAQNVTIRSNAFLTLGTSGTLFVNGSWINNSGVANYVDAQTGSTVTFTNAIAASKQIGGNTNTNFANLTNNSTTKVDVNVVTTVKNTLNLNGEFWLNQHLILGTSPTSTGALVHTLPAGFLAGPSYFRRYFDAATNSGNSGLFPMMATPAYSYKGAKLEYTTAPSLGGYIDGRFVSSTLSYYNGLPILNDAGVDINNYMNEGYWELNPSDDLTDGTYRLSLRYDGIGGINNTSLLRIIKSPMPHTAWVADGTHGGVTATEVIRNGMSGFSWFVISSNPVNPLAVELANSSIECEGNSTLIKWTTNSENEVDHFEIDEMENDTNWINIGSILATGSDNNPVSYEYTRVASRNEYHYYRLSEVSSNGIKTILQYFKNSCIDNSDLNIYPNPTRGDFTIEYFNKFNSNKADIQLIDQQGKLLFKSNTKLENGANFISVKDLPLSRGTYFVKLILDNSNPLVQKIVIE